MSRRRKRKPIKLHIRKETLFSIASVILILVGVLIMVSFSGKGEVLASINQYLVTNLGLSMLFLPFIFIASGMVLFQTEWAWTKPHILLGTMLLMIGTLGLFHSGEVGQHVFTNLGALITVYGADAVFAGFVIIGFFVMLQLSMAEILEFFASLMPKPQYRPTPAQAEQH